MAWRVKETDMPFEDWEETLIEAAEEIWAATTQETES